MGSNNIILDILSLQTILAPVVVGRGGHTSIVNLSEVKIIRLLMKTPRLDSLYLTDRYMNTGRNTAIMRLIWLNKITRFERGNVCLYSYSILNSRQIRLRSVTKKNS